MPTTKWSYFTRTDATTIGIFLTTQFYIKIKFNSSLQSGYAANKTQANHHQKNSIKANAVTVN